MVHQNPGKETIGNKTDWGIHDRSTGSDQWLQWEQQFEIILKQS